MERGKIIFGRDLATEHFTRRRRAEAAIKMTPFHDNCKTRASFTSVLFSHVYCTMLILLPVRMPNLISAQFLFKTHQTMTKKNTRNQASNISKKQKNTDNSVNQRLTVCSHPILVLVLILEEQKITLRQLILESNHSVRLYFIMSQIWTLCEFSSSAKQPRHEMKVEMKLKWF